MQRMLSSADSPGAGAPSSHPLHPRTIPCPQGGADGDGGLVRRRRVEFRVWGRLTVEPCFSRPANSRAEPSRPLTVLSLSLFLVRRHRRRRRPPFVHPVNPRTTISHVRRGRIVLSRSSRSRGRSRGFAPGKRGLDVHRTRRWNGGYRRYGDRDRTTNGEARGRGCSSRGASAQDVRIPVARADLEENSRARASACTVLRSRGSSEWCSARAMMSRSSGGTRKQPREQPGRRRSRSNIDIGCERSDCLRRW